jgi:cob(I)alamin adenosyltransferase
VTGGLGGEGGSSVYTRAGDAGTTVLLGGDRVDKHALRVETYGTMDELVCAAGVALSLCTDETSGSWPEAAELMARIQDHLMRAAAAVAAQDVPSRLDLNRVAPAEVQILEGEIDRMTGAMDKLETFILPGGTPLAAQLHVCRAVCRRAERRFTELATSEQVPSEVGPYLNRLSDWFFTAARYANFKSGVKDRKWSTGKRKADD